MQPLFLDGTPLFHVRMGHKDLTFLVSHTILSPGGRTAPPRVREDSGQVWLGFLAQVS